MSQYINYQTPDQIQYLIDSGTSIDRSIIHYIVDHISDDRIRGTLLLRAIDDGDLELVRYLLDHEVDKDFDNGAPLLQAIKLNNLNMVKLLAKYHVNFELEDAMPLVIAIKNGNPDMIRYLFRRVRIHEMTDESLRDIVSSIDMDTLKVLESFNLYDTYYRLINMAGLLGRLDIIKYFAEKNYIIFKHSRSSERGDKTVLTYAIEGQHPEVISYLSTLDKFHTEKGDLQLAFDTKNIDVVKALVINHDYLKNQALQLAVKNNDADMVAFLLDLKADPNSDHGQALITAFGNEVMVSLLLQYGGNPGYLLSSMLLDAITKQDIAQATELLTRGADPNTKDALLTAVGNNDLEMVKLLLYFRATPSFDTLSVAVKNDNIVMASYLIRYGAYIDIYNLLNDIVSLDMFKFLFDKLKTTPNLDSIIEDTDRADFVEYILNKGIKKKDLDYALYSAVADNKFEIVELLLNRGADPNYKNSLTVAIKNLKLYDKTNIIISLLEHGAVPDLFQVVRDQRLDLLELLLHYGGNPNIKDRNLTLSYVAKKTKNEAIIHAVQEAIDNYREPPEQEQARILSEMAILVEDYRDAVRASISRENHGGPFTDGIYTQIKNFVQEYGPKYPELYDMQPRRI